MERLKSLSQAIWNGPFHIGRIERPVSVGDAIMKLMETTWRFGVILVIAGVAIWLFGVGINMYRTLASHPDAEKWQDAAYQPLLPKDIEASAVISPSRCPSGTPVVVTFKNNGRMSLGTLYFSFIARQKGRSKNLAAGKWYQSDAIIDPNQSWSGCWPIPELPNDLDLDNIEIKVSVQSVYEFEDD
ncbi:hypothetical protein [Sphingosinicella sp.]|uniref:hypothetical protein n=1 Tax=Sphingosinicella sp. TaxID=1917971 RepID=UPI0026385124|nr:hypothetical protein [Sphingosinicella sp.]